MRKLTINIKDDSISDADALQLVMQVVDSGKISEDSRGEPFYCWATAFQHPTHTDKEILVYTSNHSKAPNASFTVINK